MVINLVDLYEYHSPQKHSLMLLNILNVFLVLLGIPLFQYTQINK